MRVAVTGAGGFIGGAVARALRARGDEVVAIVREPGRAAALQAIGIELVQGDLGRVTEIVAQIAEADALVHVAGSYRTGILAS